MMRALMVLVMAAAVMSGTTTVLAQTADSATWEVKYEGDVLPDANSPAFSTEEYNPSSGTVGNSVSGGVLTTSLTGSDGRGEVGWKLFNVFTDPNVGSSIEMRARLISGGGMVIRHRGAQSDFGMNIRSTNDITCGTGGGCKSGPDQTPLPNGGVITDWHIYRTTRDGGSGLIHFYMDNDPTPILGPLTGANAGNAIVFQLVGGDGSMEVDFYRATATGAFPAIPEPATLGLMSLGGLLALRRRRSA